MQHLMRILSLLVASQLFLCTHNLFAKEKWQRVYLATYPRSGNHWMRNLIEEATHIATSSVYRDREPIHLEKPFPWGGYAAENGIEGNCRYPNPREIVVIKTHFPSKMKTKYDLKSANKIIRIVRHPLDAFFSHYMHHRTELPPNGKIPSRYVKESVNNWIKFEKFWNHQPNVLTIQYENFYNEPHANFKLIMETIGYQLPEEDLNRAIAKFPPRGGLYKHLNDYYPDDLELMKSKLTPYMERYGYKFAE